MKHCLKETKIESSVAFLVNEIGVMSSDSVTG